MDGPGSDLRTRRRPALQLRTDADGSEELHRRLAAGDESALREAYDRYAGTVYDLAQRVLRDPHAAQDVTQEVFVHLWQRPAAFDPRRGTLRAWLCLLAHARAVDAVRREETRRRVAMRHAADRSLPGPVDPDHAPAADEPLLRADRSARLRTALARLSADEQRIVRLAYVEGYTYRQVAALLGIPEGTLKSRMRTTLRRLGQQLADRAA